MNDTTACLNRLLAVAFSSVISCAPLESGEERVLVFSGTAGYRHASIEAGVEAIRRLGEENGFTVLHTEDAGEIDEETLRDVSAVVFLSTTGDVLDPAQEADFERFIQAGGGFVGIHAAADTEYDWRWYGDLVGGYFDGHPPPQEADVRVLDGTHRSTEMLPATWTRFDEWYDYRDLRESLNVLLELDESSYEGGTMGDDHPIAWYHKHDGGRAWYTGLGHTEESFSEDLFLQHLLGGIRYAIGGDELDYGRAYGGAGLRRHVRMEAEDADETSPGLETTSFDGAELVAGFGPRDLLRFDDLDLAGMTAVHLRVSTRGSTGGGVFATDMIRDRLRAVIREANPAWSDDVVAEAVSRRMLGARD